MDPLSALAIVTAVFQLTEFGVKFVSKGIARYKDARARSDELRAIQQELSALKFNLQRVCDEVNGKDGFSKPQLVKILGECESLTSEIQLMVPEDGGELPLPLWTSSKTASLRRRFGKVKSMATEAIIVSIWCDPTHPTPSFLFQADLTARESNKSNERREIQFGRQMDELLQSFKLLEEKLRQRDTQAPDQGPPAVLDPCVLVQIGGRSQGLNVDQNAASETMRGLFDSGEPIPCSEMEIEIRTSLSQGFMSLPLRTRIWRRSWSLEGSDVEAQGLVTADGANVKSVAARAAARFKFEAIEARQNAVSDSMLQTYTWIFDRESPHLEGKPSWSNFPKWLESAKQPIYWITGKPGSGKSTIMKHIIRSPSLITHLRDWSKHLPLLIVNYYAWNPGTDPLQKTLEGLKRTTLYQALTKFPNLAPKLAPRVWAYYAILQHPQREHEVPLAEEWEIDESFQILISLAGKEFSLVIFIDGLDELEMHPKTTISLVESLTSSAHHVKVCVAGGPWVEFDDAYRDMPKLPMDQFTGNDLATFVRERFRTCRGFEDLRNVHPVEATELLRDITKKAKGVFIWVKVVVDSLIESITEGCGMKDLQDIVASLPSDIKNLYEALWARTPEPSRNRAAILLRLSNTEFWPLSCTEAWLADEYTLRSFDVSREELGDIGTSTLDLKTVHLYIKPLLRRKLASRTRGLLEVAFQGYPDFSHRTAHDWVKQPAIQEEVANICGELRHDPYLFLAQLLTILVSRLALCPESRGLFWINIVVRALRCASRATLSSEEDIQSLVKTLDTFDR
jgi:hypothetical protein